MGRIYGTICLLLLGFVLQTNGSREGTFSLALTHDAHTGIAQGLLWSVDLIEDEGLTDLETALHGAHTLIENPLIFCTMFFNNKMKEVSGVIQDSKDTLVKIEARIGIQRDDMDQGDDEPEADFEHLKLGQLTHSLTRLTSKLVHNKYNCQLQGSMINFIQEMNTNYAFQGALGTNANTKAVIDERLAYLKAWVHFNELRASYLAERVDSQKQTVRHLQALDL